MATTKKRLNSLITEEDKHKAEITAVLLYLLLRGSSKAMVPTSLSRIVLKLATTIQAARFAGKRLAASELDSPTSKVKLSKAENLVIAAAATNLVTQAIRSIHVEMTLEGKTYPDAVDAAVKAAESKVEQIAATEVFTGYNTTWIEEIKKSNPEMLLEWCAILDKRTCNICDGLHGKRFPASNFPPLPAHVKCRCIAIPVK